MGLMNAARQVKHAGFVGLKRGRMIKRKVQYAGLTKAGSVITQRRPYEFDAARYRRSFLVRSAPATGPSAFPRHVFAVWTGDNPLTPNRAKNLDLLRRRIGVPVELVTPANLEDWLVEGHPLRPGYAHLSLVHRSDYLRAYLMHHHGGGYVDIKEPLHSWTPSFAEMEAREDVWVAGYRELSAGSAVRLPGALGLDIALHHQRLIGNGAFLVRSHTPFTAEWLREVERRVDSFAAQAAEFPGETRGEVVGYPISWTDLMGKVFQPLQLKYLAHVKVDDRLLLNFEDYQ